MKAMGRTAVTTSRVRMMAKCLNQGWISLTAEQESGVVIRIVGVYDLVKTAFCFRIRLRRLRPSENQVVEVKRRSERTKPITKRGNVHCDWFILPLLLPTPTTWFHQIENDGVVSGVGIKWKRSDSCNSVSVALMIPLTTPIFDFHWVISAFLRLRLRFRLRLRRF